MSELFEDEEEKAIVTEEVTEDAEDIFEQHPEPFISDARRRLENLLDEKRLRDELEDFLEYSE